MERLIAAVVTTTSLVFAAGAPAQTMDKMVKVGSLGDQSGLYADIGGPGSVVAAQMAIEDSGLLAKGWKIDLISADHQNKPDVGVNIGKQLIDVEKVDAVVDLASSGVGLAIANGGKVVGGVKHPLNNADFSSFLLQAQSSKAKIIGLANAGGDTTNSIKQAAEFGIVSGGQKLAGMLMFLTDVNALGLNVAQGLNFTETFYCDMNDKTRAFTKRFNERFKKNPPTMVQAGVYSSLIHYFNALEALGGNPHDGAKVVAKMKEPPTDDPLFGKGAVRADGRKIHPAYLSVLKKPADSQYPWDYYNLVATIPSDEQFIPLEKSVCPMAKKS